MNDDGLCAYVERDPERGNLNRWRWWVTDDDDRNYAQIMHHARICGFLICEAAGVTKTQGAARREAKRAMREIREHCAALADSQREEIR